MADAYRIRVDRVVGPERQSEGSVVRKAVAHAAVPARWFEDDASAELRADVRYAALAAADGAAVLRVEVEVAVPEALRDEVPAALSATVELSRAEGTIVTERDLPVALERAIAVLDAQITLQRGDDDARGRLLADADPEIVLLALDWVETHRARHLADAVAGLAGHASERVALRAVECIGTVGGPEHARSLVLRPRVGDPAHANRLYETLANLGGDHAIGFLEFAARNEDDPDLAGLAERALARVRAGGSGGALDADEPRSPGRGHRLAAEGT